jgi:hypothetical protein
VEHVIKSISQGDTYFITVAFCLEQVSINFGLLILGNPTWLLLILSYVMQLNIHVVTVNQVCLQGWFYSCFCIEGRSAQTSVCIGCCVLLAILL